MARSSAAITFAISPGDRERLDRLVERFGHGNRSEFLRAAMHQMEVTERAERLQRLQAFGARGSGHREVRPGDVEHIVHRVLGKKRAALR